MYYADRFGDGRHVHNTEYRGGRTWESFVVLYKWNFNWDRVSVAVRVRCSLLGGGSLWRFHCSTVNSLNWSL